MLRSMIDDDTENLYPLNNGQFVVVKITIVIHKFTSARSLIFVEQIQAFYCVSFMNPCLPLLFPFRPTYNTSSNNKFVNCGLLCCQSVSRHGVSYINWECFCPDEAEFYQLINTVRMQIHIFVVIRKLSAKLYDTLINERKQPQLHMYLMNYHPCFDVLVITHSTSRYPWQYAIRDFEASCRCQWCSLNASG